jgi:hypothetical protein
MIKEERIMVRTFKCEVDFAYSSTLAEFMEYLEKYDSPKIVEYVAEGPGGGNPCLILEFMSRDMCVKFLNAHYPGDDDKFIQSQIF